MQRCGQGGNSEAGVARCLHSATPLVVTLDKTWVVKVLEEVPLRAQDRLVVLTDLALGAKVYHLQDAGLRWVPAAF